MNDYGIGAAIAAKLARGGLVAQAADLPLETRRSADLTRNIAAFARGGLVEKDVPVGSLFARGGLVEPFPAVESIPFIGSFQRGIPFIAKTGLALVHQGEAIVPKSQNQRESRGPMHVEIHQHFALDLRLQIADGAAGNPQCKRCGSRPIGCPSWSTCWNGR